MTGSWGGPIDRRQALAALGALGIGAVATACSRGGSSQPSRPKPTNTSGPLNTSAVGCVLAPDVTAGPYYLEHQKVRSDITEGRPGTPLALAITVAGAKTCDAIRNATVDIWHADADGVYSGFGNASTGVAAGGAPTDTYTFLRGVQHTDAAGLVNFTTIYPGWYRGRAVHIHIEVRADDQLVHTGQFFFPDALNTKVLTTGPYQHRGAPDTTNGSDGIYRAAGGSAATLDPQPKGDGYRAAVTVGVRNA
jgi:protocatechuate 3,4-dioxygenase beta subunit